MEEVPILMERTLTGELRSRVGERVRLAGWLHHQRPLARLTFVLLRDRAGLAQIVVDDPGAIDAVAQLLPETVLEVEATVAASEQAPSGVELRDPVFAVLSEPVEQPPVELRRPELKEQLPTILDHAAVALRHPRQREAFRIAAASLAGFRAALDGLGFVEIQTPKIVASATEGGANVFRVDYFGREAFLAQSPQFYKQTMVGVFERVYEVGPVFRAEPHDTSRHLAEYVSLDAELGFVRDHFDVMRVLREAVAGMAAAVRAAGFDAPDVPGEIPWVHFARHGSSTTSDLSPADERRLCEEHGTEFLFVTGYPMAKRPFYTHPEPGPAGVLQLVRPALPRPRAGHRRPAAAPLRGLRRRAGRARPAAGAVRGLPAGVSVRHAAARRLRARPRALGRQAHRRAEHPRDNALPARPAPAVAVERREARRATVAGPKVCDEGASHAQA